MICGMGINTKYKDSLFSFLFSDPDVLRELYCAPEGVSLPTSFLGRYSHHHQYLKRRAFHRQGQRYFLGVKPYPEETILKLSDMYEDGGSLGLSEGRPALELMVKVINIKQGKNEGIVKKSKTLSGYSAFVGKVQENETGGMERKEAIGEAIRGQGSSH
jgi:hypothetical protein